MSDARGRPRPAGPHARVASLVPSLTETVCGLGAGARLVARTMYCVAPRRMVRDVPACGGTKNPDLEAVLAREPDLVLACAEENKPEHLDALEDAGVAVHTVMPRSLDDVDALLADYGAMLDVDAGPARAALAAARDAVRGMPPRRAACLIWKDPWMGVGRGNHIDAMLGALNLTNALGDRPDYPTVSPEELATLDLDLLLLPDEPWKFTDADAEELAPLAGRVLPCEGKDLSWYGTWTAGGLTRLAGLLRDPDPSKGTP